MNTAILNPLPEYRRDLLNAIVDGQSTDDQLKLAEELIAKDEAFRVAYLEHLELHALLAWNFGCKSPAKTIGMNEAMLRATPSNFFRRHFLPLCAAALVAVCAGALVFWGDWNSSAAACAQLINAYEKLGHRTYIIHAQYDSVEPQPRVFDPRRAPLPSMDGAKLYVGDGNKFLLDRTYSNGEKLLNGGNGRESWTIRGNGTVRISANPARFRGDIPGDRQGVVFTDMRAELELLKRDYNLEQLEPKRLDVNDSAPSKRLRATRRAQGKGGARVVEIWYDASSGLIRRMSFEGLPRGNFGPSSATLDLVDCSAQPADFYDHQGHHEPAREIERLDE